MEHGSGWRGNYQLYRRCVDDKALQTQLFDASNAWTHIHKSNTLQRNHNGFDSTTLVWCLAHGCHTNVPQGRIIIAKNTEQYRYTDSWIHHTLAVSDAECENTERQDEKAKYGATTHSELNQRVKCNISRRHSHAKTFFSVFSAPLTLQREILSMKGITNLLKRQPLRISSVCTEQYQRNIFDKSNLCSYVTNFHPFSRKPKFHFGFESPVSLRVVSCIGYAQAIFVAIQYRLRLFNGC